MSEENKTVFEVGDIVEWCGIKGKIVFIYSESTRYPILVRFDNNEEKPFTKDGKYYDWHLEPSLKLIEKAKRKVKKKFWIIVGKKDIEEMCIRGSYLLKKEETIEKHELPDEFQIVEIELEVEE